MGEFDQEVAVEDGQATDTTDIDVGSSSTEQEVEIGGEQQAQVAEVADKPTYEELIAQNEVLTQKFESVKGRLKREFPGQRNQAQGNQVTSQQRQQQQQQATAPVVESEISTLPQGEREIFRNEMRSLLKSEFGDTIGQMQNVMEHASAISQNKADFNAVYPGITHADIIDVMKDEGGWTEDQIMQVQSGMQSPIALGSLAMKAIAKKHEANSFNTTAQKIDKANKNSKTVLVKGQGGTEKPGSIVALMDAMSQDQLQRYLVTHPNASEQYEKELQKK